MSVFSPVLDIVAGVSILIGNTTALDKPLITVKGLSLYLAKVIMINVGQELKADVQKDMIKALISSDTNYIDKSHSGNFISKLNADVFMLQNLISVALLNLFKDSFKCFDALK